jgi:hypothetical protein
MSGNPDVGEEGVWHFIASIEQYIVWLDIEVCPSSVIQPHECLRDATRHHPDSFFQYLRRLYEVEKVTTSARAHEESHRSDDLARVLAYDREWTVPQFRIDIDLASPRPPPRT